MFLACTPQKCQSCEQELVRKLFQMARDCRNEVIGFFWMLSLPNMLLRSWSNSTVGRTLFCMSDLNCISSLPHSYTSLPGVIPELQARRSKLLALLGVVKKKSKQKIVEAINKIIIKFPALLIALLFFEFFLIVLWSSKRIYIFQKIETNVLKMEVIIYSTYLL